MKLGKQFNLKWHINNKILRNKFNKKVQNLYKMPLKEIKDDLNKNIPCLWIRRQYYSNERSISQIDLQI